VCTGDVYTLLIPHNKCEEFPSKNVRVVGRIQECKISSAAKYVDTGSLSKYNRVTNP